MNRNKVKQLTDMLIAHGNAITKGDNGGYAYACGFLQSILEGAIDGRNENIEKAIDEGIGLMIEKLIEHSFTKAA